MAAWEARHTARTRWPTAIVGIFVALLLVGALAFAHLSTFHAGDEREERNEAMLQHTHQLVGVEESVREVQVDGRRGECAVVCEKHCERDERASGRLWEEKDVRTAQGRRRRKCVRLCSRRCVFTWEEEAEMREELEGGLLAQPGVAAALHKPAPCTMQRCFDFARCGPGQPFRIFVYDDPRGDVRSRSQPFQLLLNAVRRSSHYTDDPDEACLFFPAFDTSCYRNECIERKGGADRISERLAALPYWGERGRNHVVLDLSDLSTHTPMDTGEAILLKSSMPRQAYRMGFDVAFPLFQRWSCSSDERHFPAAKRKYLLTFKGSRYPPPVIKGAIRSTVGLLHNGGDIIVATRCWHGAFDARCQHDDMVAGKYDYHDLLVNTRFALVMPGRGHHSSRLLEVMAAGAIPVILNNDLVLPLGASVQWDDCSVRVREEDVGGLPSLLRGMDGEAIAAMQARVIDVYEQVFASTDLMLERVLDVVRSRVGAEDDDEEEDEDDEEEEEEGGVEDDGDAAVDESAPRGAIDEARELERALVQ